MYKLSKCISWLSICAIVINWSIVKSALLFTTNSEYGIFMAISVPISLTHRNVFLSYNYEFNYYQPEHVYKYPPILMGQDFEDSYLTYPTTGRNAHGVCHNCTDWKLKENTTTNGSTKASSSREKRALTLMSRTVFYAMIKDKLRRSGFPGEACLLRLICETNASQLGEVNGFLGSLVHIIFSPSSSKDEYLPHEYYQAEWDGLKHQSCVAYTKKCPENVLDLISVPLEQALSDIISRRRRK
ncbi:uncharacterized protein Dana_GF13499 [Drosophila ananassae]|uniref:Uncharacterized protein n=1 Tax=Drosophila ananassae TaxID=7217 RepID=B3ME00_DROAN|nr:uncharacterized protein LOC6496338 [Drosophila ananassae]EDV37545.2 uncharacterized protein Dana_GF13499 [Drosophila ananassae]